MDHMSNKMKLSLVIVDQILGPHVICIVFF